MTDKKWTKPNRLTEVTRHEASPVIVGAVPGPSVASLKNTFSDDFSETRDGDTVWEVWITTRTGLDKEVVGLSYFATEEAAAEAVASMPVGMIYGDHYGFPKRLKEIVGTGGLDPSGMLSFMFGSGDHDAVHFVCYEALAEAGVISIKDYSILPSVLDWLGEEHVAWMRNTFGENWSAVAQFEFCLNHFPDSSLVSLSAKLFLSQFVTNDDFTAGYITKEIEAISGGTEDAAFLATNTQKKAGEAGARASRDRKLRNLEILMQEIEQLSGAVGLISEERIFEQALEKSAEKQKDFPKSRKTHAEYGTALRSDEPFKSRYEAVFRKNA
ncbi:hypothetical protein D1823_11600 [Ruegeria sp. AD91A]|uniref:hypothetical protein n=1 Tax=Ruegeria sp. AD91A TaxID=2293862 RepID=UPI000E4F58C1|nr:hypothetical protein [Ruegeria sp. AD91A]AXT27167.1 hypothetical protein D1823_11600 [Ruegeria sp. AD91A]